MDRRATLLGITGGVVTGPELLQQLQAWLTGHDQDTQASQENYLSPLIEVGEVSKLSDDHIEILQLTARKLYDSCKYYGGSHKNRELAVQLLHKVSVAAREKQATVIQQKLYNIMASLAHTIAEISWHQGLERSAQNYYQLALRASHAGDDRLFGLRILMDHARQMYYLGKYQDALNLIQLAQQGTHSIAGSQIKAMMVMREAWMHAALGHYNKFQCLISLSEKLLARSKIVKVPYWVVCNKASLAALTGRSLSLIAVHKPNEYAEIASEHIVKAIKLRDHSTYRYSALDYIWLAENRFLLNDMKSAINSIEKALTIYGQLQQRCGATHRRLQNLFQYTNQATRSKELQSLNLKLKSVLAIA